MTRPEKSLRFARHFSWNALGQGGVWVAQFLLVPYLIEQMGLELYGVYILLHAVSNYLSLLTFGAGSATIIHMSRERGERRGRALRQTFRASGLMHAVGVGIGAALFFATAPWVAQEVFRVPREHLPAAITALRWGALGSVCFSAFQFGGSVLQGLQRFDRHGILLLAVNAALPLGTFAVFKLGGALPEAAAWYFAVHAAAALAAVGLARREAIAAAPDEGPDADFRAFRRTLGGIFVAQLAGIAVSQFDKLFLIRYLSLTELTQYAIPSGLLARLQTLPAMIAVAVVPMLSELSSAEAEEGLERMYLKASRAVLSLVLPGFAILFAVMPQLLSLWVGVAFSEAGVWPARLLTLAQALATVALIPTAVAYSRGRPFGPTAASVLQAVLTLASWWVLVPRLGILGVGAGALLGQLAAMPVVVGYTHSRVVPLALGRYLREGLLAPAAGSAATLAVVFPLHAWAGTWPRLVGLCAGGGLVYLAVFWALMSDDDRRLARLFAQKAVSRLRGAGA